MLMRLGEGLGRALLSIEVEIKECWSASRCSLGIKVSSGLSQLRRDSWTFWMPIGG